MKKVFFDSGPIISLTTNNLLFLLDEFKKKGDFEFYITPAVKKELIDRPIQTKKYKFEALQVAELLKRGTLKVYDGTSLNGKTMDLLSIANNIYFAQDSFIQIVHFAEIETLCAAEIMSADLVIVDERTTRFLLEDPNRLLNLLSGKLHTSVTVNKENLEKFKNTTFDIKVIRSCELVAVAYELGFLDRFIPDGKSGKRDLLESVIWGVKLNGCAISENEVDELIKIESQSKEG